MTKETNPFFKYGKEDLNPICKKTIGFKLPKSLFCTVENCDKNDCKDMNNIPECDFFKHFSQKDKSLVKDNLFRDTNFTGLNVQRIMESLIVDYMNSQCLERKYFDIDVVLAINSNNFVYLGCRDDYYINKNDLTNDYELFERKYDDYFIEDKYLNTTSLINLKEKGYFTDTNLPNNESSFATIRDSNGTRKIKLSYDAFIDEFIEDKFIEKYVSYEELKYYGYFYFNIVQFRINNFLDEFINGVYKTNYGNKFEIHKGLCKYIKTFRKIQNNPQKPPKTFYFSYDWSFDENMNIIIHSVNPINDIDEVISNSSNVDLKKFFNNKDIILSDDKDSQIQKLIKENEELSNALNSNEIKNLKDKIQQLEEENSSLKEQLNSQ